MIFFAEHAVGAVGAFGESEHADAFAVGVADDVLHPDLEIRMVLELRPPGVAQEFEVVEMVAGGIDELIILGDQGHDAVNIVCVDAVDELQDGLLHFFHNGAPPVEG